jgi:methylthioribose-1-phosphate isomerase
VNRDEPAERMVFPTVDFRAGTVHIIDQTLLPAEERMLELSTVDEVAEAIRSLRVRGAPAIGLAAAYGVLLALEVFLGAACAGRPDYFFDRMEGMRPFEPGSISVDEIRRTLREAGSVLAETRPTAVNLFWALGRMEKAGMREAAGVRELCSGLAGEAFAIHDEELKIEYAIAENGSPLIRDGMRILTHCNAGGLATAGYGTALGVIARAHEEGKHFTVYADETRPLLQGARLTAWELKKRGIDVTVLCDNAAASLFASSAIRRTRSGRSTWRYCVRDSRSRSMSLLLFRPSISASHPEKRFRSRNVRAGKSSPTRDVRLRRRKRRHTIRLLM